MFDVREMKFSTVYDPEVGTQRAWRDYLGLGTPQYLQIFRTNFPLNCRMVEGEAQQCAHRALERHVRAINLHLEKSRGAVIYSPPYEGDPPSVEEGAGAPRRRMMRQMHGMQSFIDCGVWPGELGTPGILALRSRALHLMNPWPYETCEGYMSDNARECSWISEVALGFSSDKRCYYRTFEGYRIDAFANWDLSEFNG